MLSTTKMVERASSFLDARISRRSMLVRSAFAGSAVSFAGTDYLLKPQTAYEALCYCGSDDCGCGDTCCAGYTEFCCSINGGYNYCPTGTIMGGWWLAEGSEYCDGPRYYMDCNAVCACDDGCGDGYTFCDPGCDGLDCGCAFGDCDQFVTGCFQFRYGQCNQEDQCLGRIACRVVACVPPWTVDPTCTTTVAEDDGTADQNASCWTSAPPSPPPPPCASTATQCEVVGMAGTVDSMGYWMVTSFGKIFSFGVAADSGDASATTLVEPIVGMAPGGNDVSYYLVAADGGIFSYGNAAPFHGSEGGKPLNQPMVGMAVSPITSGFPASPTGYWTVASDGGVFTFGSLQFYGSMGGKPLNEPMVGMAATPTGLGYWTVASDGGIFCFGDAQFYGSMGGKPLNAPMVGMAATPTGLGYWTVASDGGIFCFGDAAFDGSEGGKSINWPVAGMAHGGSGYWLVGQDGSIYPFGPPSYGSPPGSS